MIDKLDFERRLLALRTSEQKTHGVEKHKSNEHTPISLSPPAACCPIPSENELSTAQRRHLYQSHGKSMSYLDTSLHEFGDLYAKAIQLAQKAVSEERKRNVRQAVGSYVQAGELLTEIGRKQSNHQVQYTLKKKAFAILQRAEALADWIEERKEQETACPAVAANDDTIALQEEHIGEKRFALTTLRAQNERMAKRVHKLANILQARRRFRKLAGSLRTQNWSKKELDRADSETQQQQGIEPRPETKKLVLVNELHAYLGLPELDQFTKFKPLSTDELIENKLRELEVELEESRRESIRLRQALVEKEKLIGRALLRETPDTVATSNNAKGASSDASTTTSPSVSPTRSLPDDFENRDMMLELQNILRKIQKDETASQWDDIDNQSSDNQEETIDDGVWL